MISTLDVDDSNAVAVSPAQRRQMQRFESKLRKRLNDPIGQAQVRRSAELACERILKAVLRRQQQQQQNSTLSTSILPQIPSFDLSVASSCNLASNKQRNSDVIGTSEHSSERATRRGSRRGARERNDIISLLQDIDEHCVRDDHELNTLATDPVTNESAEGAKSYAAISKWRSKWKNTEAHSNSVRPEKSKSGNDGDAWMCGVCGLVFATLAAADKHESLHIQEVVSGLGWKQQTNTPGSYYDKKSSPVALPVSEIFRHRAHSEDSRSKAMTNQQRQEHYLTSSQQPIAKSMNRQTPTSRYFDSWERNSASKMERPSALTPSLRKDDKLSAGAPVSRTRVNSEVRFSASPHVMDPLLGKKSAQQDDPEELLLSRSLRDSVVLADEALLDVSKKAESLILTKSEMAAERELELLAADKAYYDDMAKEAVARRVNPAIRFRSDGESILGKVQNKFVDAYQIMKQGDWQRGLKDQYTRKKKDGEGEDVDIEHTDRTLYVNVMVRNSVQVVRHELERLAGKRWEASANRVENLARFERFRVFAHVNMVKLAGIALASDFTPRRIAVQLSNDLYRLMTPRLRRRGVTIEAEIEYRVGPYFVLAVNIKSIDWQMLVKATHKDVALRKQRWANESKHEGDTEEAEEEKSYLKKWFDFVMRIYETPMNDILASFLYWMYFFNFTIYVPICYMAYHTFLGTRIRKFILANVSNEIFYYVEEKGMEMEIGIRAAAHQAAFMLSALREIRAGDRALEKRRQESKQQEKGVIIGPLLGPAIKADASPAVKPEGFEVPANLEFVGLELDIPVGFRRLRWAMLSRESKFVLDGIYRTEAKYDDITAGEWDKHAEFIGATELPESIDPKDFIGATKEGSYMMPRSAFVAANMCYETYFIEAYNDYCFCFKKRAKNPDAPFGTSFIAWTQYLVVNLGNNSCRLYCSVEAEFPNGEPMVSRQIRSGMRAGTGELFVLVGETIAKYADEYP